MICRLKKQKRLFLVLTEYGYKPKIPFDAKDFANDDKRKQWVDEKGMQVFSMYQPQNPFMTVDLFVDQPKPFIDLWEKSELMDLEGVNVRVCSFEDLIEMKKTAGRTKDLIDIEYLTRIKDHE